MASNQFYGWYVEKPMRIVEISFEQNIRLTPWFDCFEQHHLIYLIINLLTEVQNHLCSQNSWIFIPQKLWIKSNGQQFYLFN